MKFTKKLSGGWGMMAVRILVVDDTKFMRLMLTDMLRKMDFEVVGEAESGSQAIQMYMELKPDIIMLDITMPELDGIGALKELRKINPDCVVVICSAMSQQDLISEAIKAGANDYVMKPFAAARVQEVLSKMIALLPAPTPVQEIEAVLEQGPVAELVEEPLAEEVEVPAPETVEAASKAEPAATGEAAVTPEPVVQELSVPEMNCVVEPEPMTTETTWSIRPFQNGGSEAELEQETAEEEQEEIAVIEEDIEAETTEEKQEENVEKVEQQELALEDTVEYSSETWYQYIPDESETQSVKHEAAAECEPNPVQPKEAEPQIVEEQHSEAAQEPQQDGRTKPAATTSSSASSNIVVLHQDRTRRGPNRMRNFNSSYMCNWSEEIKGEEVDYQVICSTGEDRISIIAVKDGDKCQNINFSISGYLQLVEWLEDKIGSSLHMLQDEQM
jgi:YesN/AraC family two-component response regulator